MKIPEGYKMPEANSNKPRSAYSIKLQKSLYGLKQSGRMWYNRLSEYLLKEGYVNDQLCPCVFIKKTRSGFAIIAVCFWHFISFRDFHIYIYQNLMIHKDMP